MKRLFAFLLSLVLLFSLTGAGTPVLGGDPEPASDSGFTTEALFSLGTINGDVYENPYIGYGCKLENWTYADAEYIAQINNLSGVLMSSDIQKAMRESGAFTEMLATSPDKLSSVTIQYQDITATYGEAFSVISLDTFVELVAPMMPSALEQAGYKDVSVEAGVVKLGGDDHPGFIIHSSYFGMPCYQKEACIKTDDYMVFICVSSFTEDHTDELLSYFYPLTAAASDPNAGILCCSPKEELDFAFRYNDSDWTYEIDSEGVTFTKTSAVTDSCQILFKMMDMTGMEAFADYAMEIVVASAKTELEEQFENIVFSETSETIVGGKYTGRSMDMLIDAAPLFEQMHAYMTTWTTGSKLYMLVAYSADSELDSTLSMFSQLLDSFETADDYLARTGEVLQPAA